MNNFDPMTGSPITSGIVAFFLNNSKTYHAGVYWTINKERT